MIARRLAGGMRTFGLAEDGIDYVHEGPHAGKLSPALVARVAALRGDVIEGRTKVPTQ